VRTKVPIEAQTTPLSFYLVCDFESFLAPLEREEEEECNSMKKLDVHSVSGFCCYCISSEPKYRTPPKVYSGPDPMTEFYDHVVEESRVISKIVSHQVAMRPMTSDEHKLHEAATDCVNCGGPFSDQNLKVRPHDHVSGEYLFPACQKCNLQLKPRKAGKKRKYCSDRKENYEENFVLPILFHNLKYYDADFVPKHFERKYVEHHGEDGSVSLDDVEVTPQNSENIFNSKLETFAFWTRFSFFSRRSKNWYPCS